MSNQVVYFVSEEKIKSFTQIHENVNIDDILPYVKIAQDVYLQIILGSEFYKNLESQIVGATVSSQNTTLIDEYIAPFVMNAALYEMVPFTYVKLRNKGMLKGQSEDATTADLKDVQYYRDAIRVTREFYGERLRRELVMNIDLYPVYAQLIAKQNLIPNRREQFGSGIAIPNRNSKSNNQNYGGGVNGGNRGYNGDYGNDWGYDLGWEKFGPGA